VSEATKQISNAWLSENVAEPGSKALRQESKAASCDYVKKVND